MRLPVTPSRTPKRRKTSGWHDNTSQMLKKVFKATASRAPLRKKGGGGIVSETSTGLYKAAKKVVRKKGVTIKKKKTVKITKKFKKQVEKAIEPGKVQGTVVNHYLGGAIASVSPNQNDFYSGANTTCATPWMFTPSQFIDAASQLFRFKGPNNLTAGLKFDNPENFKIGANFTVVDSWCKYKLKNITQHVMIVKMFECAPKRKSSYCVQQQNVPISYTSGGALLGTPDCLQTPFWYWVDSCQQDAQLGVVLPGNINGAVGQQTPQTLFSEPGFSTTFSKNYKSQKTEIVLQPGQESAIFVQGPQGVDIDIAKMFSQDIFQDIQMYSRAFVTTVYDAPNASVSEGAATYGRFGSNADKGPTRGYACVTEREDHYKIRMPEQTGMNIPALTVAGGVVVAGQIVDLSNRRHRKIVNVYTAADIGPTVDINENNPTTQLN